MGATIAEIMNGNWQFLLFSSKFKRDNSVKNQQTITKFKLDLHILKTNLHMQFQSYTYKEKLDSRNWKFLLFSKFKRDNSVKNQRTIIKLELDLRISMSNLHMQFQPYTYIQTKVRERKLKISSRDNSVINHQTTTKFKLDLRSPLTYPYIKFEWNVCNPYRDNERKLKFLIFYVQEG